MTRAALLLFALGLVASCKEEHDPVGVPFEGIDPKGPKSGNDSGSQGSGSASGSASANGSASAKSSGGSGWGTGLEPCCAALRSAANNGKTAGERANYSAAANACDLQRKQIIDGKVNRSQAMAAVRATLLGDAPGACR